MAHPHQRADAALAAQAPPLHAGPERRARSGWWILPAAMTGLGVWLALFTVLTGQV